jgi:Spy/CpxP family protein refolding chaperone
MKSRKNFWRIAAAVAVLGIAVTGFAIAQVGPGFGPFAGHPGERIIGFVSDYLDLTPAQQAEAKALFESSRTANAAVVAQLKTIAMQAHDAVKAGKSDAELQQIAASVGPLVSQVAANHLKAMSRFYNLLTPEQKGKADKLHQRMRSRAEQGFPGHAPQIVQ